MLKFRLNWVFDEDCFGGKIHKLQLESRHGSDSWERVSRIIEVEKMGRGAWEIQNIHNFGVLGTASTLKEAKEIARQRVEDALCRMLGGE